MPAGAFGGGLTNAESVFDNFAVGDIVFATALMTTADVALGVAHGLSGAPDFVIFQGSNDAASIVEGMAWTSNATTLTFLKVDTQDTAIISYIAGNLS